MVSNFQVNNDPKRKEFLDELVDFMFNRGTPINPSPVMSKKNLDLFELYKLVCDRGGLLEVIENKLWPEVIRGLQISNTLTSAAFTLRNKYIKLLYPFECLKWNFSRPSDLQAVMSTKRRSVQLISEPSHGASIFQGTQTPLSSLLSPQNILMRYLKMAEEQRRRQQEEEVEAIDVLTPMVSIHEDSDLDPQKIKRERESDDEDIQIHEYVDSTFKKLKLERDFDEEKRQSPKEEEANQNPADISFVGGMQFELKRDANGQLKINLNLDGVRYESVLKVV